MILSWRKRRLHGREDVLFTLLFINLIIYISVNYLYGCPHTKKYLSIIFILVLSYNIRKEKKRETIFVQQNIIYLSKIFIKR